MPTGMPGSWTHGLSGYHHGCRCDICYTTKSEYQREWYRYNEAMKIARVKIAKMQADERRNKRVKKQA